MRDKAIKVIDRIIEYSLYLLIFFIPISKAPLQIFSSIAFLAFILKKIIKPDFNFLKTPIHYFMLAFAIFCAISIFNAGSLINKALFAFFFKWMKYLGLFLFFEETFVTPKRVRNAMMIILFGSALLGIDGLFQKFSGVDFLRHKDLIPVLSSGTFGVCASFNHYNDFGAYLIVVLSLVIALSILDKFMCLDFMILLFLETLLSLCLVFTFSRGAWLGLVFSMILMMIISSKNMAKKIVFLIPVFIGIVVLVPELRERIIFTFTPKGDANRIEVWKIAITIIKENPFIGKGIGLFMDCFSKITRLNAQYAHNCYLQIWVETGIFSLLSFLGFLGLLFWNGIKRFKNNKDPVLLGLICGLFGFAVHAFFDTQLYSIQTSMLFWSLAGILSVLSTKQIEV